MALPQYVQCLELKNKIIMLRVIGIYYEACFFFFQFLGYNCLFYNIIKP
jgi:hypothetical protein